ncbi:MAG: helix-turn-helix transcriptional regulator, partial [Simkania sp.]|nr:helix-turn-helix transcriptional regulator [Simkania sp.]
LKAKKGGSNRRGGYGVKQRQTISERIEALSRTWVKVLEMDIVEEIEGKKRTYRKKRKWKGESLAIVVSSRFGEVDDKEQMDPFVWNLRPGDIFSKFLMGPGRQTALLAQKALEYDPYRQKYEKRLARYLSYQWRVRQKDQNYLYPFTVETLLNAASINLKTKNLSWIKDRLEKVLDTLVHDYILENWEYGEGFDESIIGKRGWLKKWLKWKVLVSPPSIITEHYDTKIVTKPEKVLKSIKSTAKATITPVSFKAEEKAVVSLDLFGENVSDDFDLGLIRQTRKSRGLTLMQASQEIGISTSRLSRIERGVTKTTIETLQSIRNWIES